MKITCPQCETAYDVTPAALGSEGRQVRCARCQTVWFAEFSKSPATPDGLAEATPGAATIPPEFQTDATPMESAAAEAQDSDEPQHAVVDSDISLSAEPEASPDIGEASLPRDGEPEAPPADTAAKMADPPPAEAAPDRPSKSREAAAPHFPEAEPARVHIDAATTRRPVGRRTKRAPHPVWHARGLTAAIVVLAIIDAGLIFGRASIVRALPQTASLYEIIGLPVNLRDLTFKDIKTTEEKHNGSTILLVEGTIVATGRVAMDVPRLRFAISAANGHEIYAWTALPPRNKLAPGEAMPFRTRLASPPEQGQTVKIRFFNRRDITAGLS